MKQIDEKLGQIQAIIRKTQEAANILTRIMKASTPIKKPSGTKAISPSAAQEVTIDDILNYYITAIKSFKDPVGIESLKELMENMVKTYSSWLKHHEEVSRKLFVSKKITDRKIKNDAAEFEKMIKDARESFKALEPQSHVVLELFDSDFDPMVLADPVEIAKLEQEAVPAQRVDHQAPSVAATSPLDDNPQPFQNESHEQLARTLAELYNDESNSFDAEPEQEAVISPPPQPLPVPQQALVREIKIVPRQPQQAIYEESPPLEADAPTITAELGEEFSLHITDTSLYELGEEFSNDTDTESPKAVEQEKKPAKLVSPSNGKTKPNLGGAPALTELQRAWQLRSEREQRYVAAHPEVSVSNNK